MNDLLKLANDGHGGMRRWEQISRFRAAATMNDLLKLANDGHGGMRRWEQISRFRAAASIAGAIWALKGKPGLLEDVVLDGETRDQRADDNAVPAAGPVYH